MTIQSSGAIYLSNLQTEFGGSNPIFMSEYYKGGGLVHASSTNPNGIPTSGAIDLQDFYGSSQYVYVPPPTVRVVSGPNLSGSLGGFFGPNKSYSASVTSSYYNNPPSTFHVVVNPSNNNVIQIAFNGFSSQSHANDWMAFLNGDTLVSASAGTRSDSTSQRGGWASSDQPEPGIFVFTNTVLQGTASGVAGGNWSLTFGP